MTELVEATWTGPPRSFPALGGRRVETGEALMVPAWWVDEDPRWKKPTPKKAAAPAPAATTEEE